MAVKSKGAGRSPRDASPEQVPFRTLFSEFLFSPIPITSLVYVRILFGAILLWWVSPFFFNKLIEVCYIDPPIHYTFSFFQWVKPWSATGMYIQVGILLAAAVGVMAGLFYRASCIIFCLGFLHIFLMEKTLFQNHYYLIVLLSFLMALVPAHRRLSLDVWWGLVKPTSFVPAWNVWILRLMMGIVYVYAAIAKIDGDWFSGWILLTIVREVASNHEMPFLVNRELIMFMTYSGFFYDLLVFPLLLSKKTRWFALAGSLIFHLSNHFMLEIGVFPWMALGLTFLLFFSDCLPALPGMRDQGQLEKERKAYTVPSERYRRWVTTFFVTFLTIQLLLPLRLHLYEGNPAWTLNGERFAWRMMLNGRSATEFDLRGQYTDPNGERKAVKFALPASEDVLRRHWQYRRMMASPDMILQYAHWHRDELIAQGCTDIDIRALVEVSLNGREPQRMVDPRVNLAKEERHYLASYDWVLPLVTPRRPAPWAETRARLEEKLK